MAVGSPETNRLEREIRDEGKRQTDASGPQIDTSGACC